MTAERFGPKQMIEAEMARRGVVEVIDKGKAGSIVSMDLNIGTLMFRLDKEELREMGERKQKLGISVKNEKVFVELLGSEETRRGAYQFFYGLLQAVKQGVGEEFLQVQEVPSSLKEIPDLKSYLEVIQKGTHTLPDEDLLRLQIYLLADWISLRDKSGLPIPEQVFTSLR